VKRQEGTRQRYYIESQSHIEQMATAVEDGALRSTFLQAALVQEIYERAARLGG
jgi:hypothetical protein